MNLLLVNYEYPPLGGGAANATFFLAQALRDLGHKAVVLTSGFADLPEVEDDGVTVIRLPINRRRADRSNVTEMGKFLMAARKQCVAIARSHSINAVIAFFTLPSGPVALRLHRKLGLPYLISLRGGDVPGLVPEIRLLHRLLLPWRRQVLRHARTIVANDQGLADLATSADPFPVRVVPNGVDCEFFRPNPGKPINSGAPFRWLFCGRLHPQKNLHHLLAEFAAAQSAPDSDAVLEIIGDGPLRDTLSSQATALGLSRRVTWHGWLGKDQIKTIYQTADAFLNPSLYEGMPNTVLEAMASGLPVLASDIPGNRTLVRNEVSGLLINPRTPGDITNAIRRMQSDRAWGRRLGAAGREFVISRHSWKNVAQSYLELIDASV